MSPLLFINVTCFWVNIAMAIYVLYVNRHALVNKVFSVYCMMCALWSFGTLFTLCPYSSKSMLDVAIHFHAFGAIPFVSLWFIFLTAFQKNRFPDRKYLIVIAVFIVYITYSHLNNEFIYLSDTKAYYGWPYYFKKSIPSAIFIIQALLFSTMGWVILITVGYYEDNFLKQKQARSMLVLGLIILPGAVYNSTFAPYFRLPNIPPVGHIFATLWLYSILYAMVKYKFIRLNVETASSEIISSVIESMFLVDADNRIIDVNPAAENLLGLSKEKILKLPVNSVIGNEPITGAETKKEITLLINNVERVFSNTVSPVRDRFGNTIGNVVMLRDITEEKQSEEKLKHIAMHDALTNLPNRIFMQEYFNMSLSKAKRHKSMLGIMLIDLDKFKEINDTLGHHAGDMLLVQVADRMKKKIREYDMLARMGGDEFVVIICDIYNVENIKSVAENILKAYDPVFDLDGKTVSIKPSIGISLYPDHGDNSDILFKKADTAMYRSKNEGGNKYIIF